MSSKTDKDVLLDMGFEEIKMLFAHADDPIESFIVEENNNNTVSTSAANDNQMDESNNSSSVEAFSASDAVAKSLVCNVCKKVIKDAQAAEFHAVKTGHQDFSESTEAFKPLTEEEKKAKLEELKERLKEKRLMKQKEEQEYEKQKEKVRRRTGKELNEARERLEKEELKRIYEKKKREQIEEKKARARIKAQIEQDKKERAAK
ncbi:hypothetical protein PIROE2DRAFT_5697, partial [Piromyces sp. E2]